MATSTRYNRYNKIYDDDTDNINKKFSKSRLIKYKFRAEIWDESTIRMVYDFCKKDLKSFKNTYKNSTVNDEPVLTSCYDLYIEHEDEDEEIVFTHIYHEQIDKNGVTLTKKKMFIEEDFTIQSNYFIYIIIELHALPGIFDANQQKEIHDVLKPVFKLCGGEERDIYEPIPNKIIRYKSKTIETGNSTPQEIFNQTLPHLIIFQCLYKNDRIDDTPASTTTYTVEVVGDELHRVLYHGELDKNGVITRESKPYEVISLSINAPYKVYIVIGIYCHPEEQEENLEERVNRLVEERINQLGQNAVNERTRWLEEQAQDTVTLLEMRARRLRKEIKRLERPRAEDLQINIRSTKEDMCCVCLAKPPNLMFSNCGHLCLCEECNDRLNSNHNFEAGNLKCPMCRTEVSQQRIIM